MTRPIGSSETRSAKARQRRKASGIRLSPVGRPVFMMTSRAKRSGCWLAAVRPMSPPQSCTTRVTRCRSSASRNPFRMSRGQRGNQLAVQVAPGRLTVQAEHRIAMAFVDVVHPQALDVQVARRKRKNDQPGKAFVGGGQNHGGAGGG